MYTGSVQSGRRKRNRAWECNPNLTAEVTIYKELWMLAVVSYNPDRAVEALEVLHRLLFNLDGAD